jgi:hypothetical protein
MSTRVFEFTIEVFWVDDKKYGNDLIETIDFYDELEIMIKIVKPDLDDLEFMGNSKLKDSSTHGSTLRVLLAGFNCLPVLGSYSPRCLPPLLYFSNVPWIKPI